MRQRTIGPLTVSAIGLGCMNMSFGYGPAEDATSIRLLNQALDEGYNFLDTAMAYGSGHNESLIGKALESRRGDYILATKCGLSRDAGIDGRPDVLAKNCEDSLQRLRTDVIDLYYLHRVDPKVPIEDSVGALARLVEQGKVRQIGLSEVSSQTLRRAHAVHPIAALQSEYSLWSRTPERGILFACAELDVTLVPFSPLGRGFLAGSASDVTQLAENDLRCTIARPRFEPDAFAKNARLLEPLRDIAKCHDCTMAQLALAWLLARQNETMVPIPGTKDIDHMIENAGADRLELSIETIAQLNELINETTVTGTRYTLERMAATDSERD